MALEGKIRWGEVEDDAEDLDFLLPPKQVIGPDQNGLKKIVEYMFNEEGKKVKKTTTIRTRPRLSKGAIERRSWPKFGDAVDDDVSARLTMISTEEIILERPTADDETFVVDRRLLRITPGYQKSGYVPPSMRGGSTNVEKGSDETFIVDRRLSRITPGSQKSGYGYVPPSMRGGCTDVERGSGGGGNDRYEMRRRNEENSVRVSNLSEDTREADLFELFRPFGNVSRVYVAVDQKTGMSRGFGFVNFFNREDGERAINKLNGYGYDNLILRLEWAAARPT